MFLTVALLVLLAAAAFLAYVWAFQRQMLYYPGPGPVPPASAALPGALDMTLETEDGLRLGAYFLPAMRPRTGATVVFCNGNAGDRSHRTDLARSLVAAGHSVLLFDYRGYAGNPGSPTETGLAADARAALRFLESRDDVDRDKIVYFGESLGAAVAARLAAERPPRALVLRSPFTTIVDVGRIHYPYLPVVDALVFDRYRTIDAVRSLQVPLLVIAGADDRLVPPAFSRRVFDAAAGPKRFLLVPDSDHNAPALVDGSTGAVIAFLDDVLAGRPLV